MIEDLDLSEATPRTDSTNSLGAVHHPQPARRLWPWLLFIAAAITIMAIGPAAASSRQLTTPANPNQTIEDLQAELAKRDARLADSIEWRRNLQSRVYEQNRTISSLEFELSATVRPTLAEQDALWAAGYVGAGGQHLDRFQTVILPCESGGAPGEEHTVVGPTDDWGRAQINRPVWSDRFEEKFGVDFETHITNPVLNGAMAAVVEQEHHGRTGSGLQAWTCHRRNR